MKRAILVSIQQQYFCAPGSVLAALNDVSFNVILHVFKAAGYTGICIRIAYL